MSKPTQAQIEARQCQDNALEAAAKQIHHELGCTITAARIAAAKALTAAAEVGKERIAFLEAEIERVNRWNTQLQKERNAALVAKSRLSSHNHVFKNGKCIACDLTEEQIAALAAAAEVGRDPDIVLEGTREGVLLMCRAERNATIERCAKAVEDSGGDNAEYHAAAIRALKDKT